MLVESWTVGEKNEIRVRAVKVGCVIREVMADFLRKRGFVEISPVIISKITDPLAHPVFRGEIKYYGDTYYLMRSMIFHKQISLLYFDKIFCFSPNVRLEMAEKAGTGRHLFEFTQIDLEIRNGNRDDAISLAEKMFVHIIKEIKRRCREELEFFGRSLKIPVTPFKRYRFADAYEMYGDGYEMELSAREKEPFWVIDFPKWKREFYDREEGEYLADMDLIYPEGFGEALSGGEREYKYERILKRMEEKGENLKDYAPYLSIARKGLYPSAGFGVGLERMVRYICGLSDISLTTLFPKVPGMSCI